MVALVLVSHSRKLAEAARQLILQMTGPDFPVVVASGVGDNFDELGTDAVHISDVLQQVSRPDGILVLMDLGNAVLSAQTALELLESDATPIRLCSAPFVEGAVAAAVSAQAGCSLADVAREAERGLAAKQQQLRDESSQQPRPAESHATTAVPGPTAELILTIENAHGLHARPVAALVRTASKFAADIDIFNLTSGAGPVTARSLTSLSLLQIRKGDRIRVACTGDDCQAAAQAIRELAAAGFGEPVGGPAVAAPVPVLTKRARLSEAQGSPGSDGIAIGPLALLPMEELPQDGEPADAPAAELTKLTAAIRAASAELLRNKAQGSEYGTRDAILEAQALVLADPMVINKLQSVLDSKRISASRAWVEVTADLAAQYRAMDDPYLRERAADVLDISRRVLRHLTTGEAPGPIRLPQPSILLVEELLPSEASACEPDVVLGVIAANGSATSHSAIILRALGIPMVVGATGVGADDVGKLVALDGSTGEFWINPDQHTVARLEKSKQLEAHRAGIASAAANQPSITLDGARMEVLANAGSVQDSALAAQNGAEGIGLLRTEFLFASRREAPSEDEQVRALRELYAPISGPVVVRTLDVGADKPLAFFPQSVERNPYLGVRGIRLSLQTPELFLTHLRAILRSGEGREVWLMFPMISHLKEAEQVLKFLERAHQQLAAQGTPHLWPLKRGIMIEVPSAALLSEQLAADLDFFSIGTNDLTQYTMAAERGNAAVAELQDALSPAVLRLMQLVVEGAGHHKRHVSVCGDAASDPLAAAIFAGIGIHSLSVRPRQAAEIKALFRGLRMSELKRIASRATQCHEAAEVRSPMRTYVESMNGLRQLPINVGEA